MSEKCFADIIILGNTIPGAFAAHLLKEKLSSTFEILLINHRSAKEEWPNKTVIGNILGKDRQISKLACIFDKKSDPDSAKEILEKSSHRTLKEYENYIGLGYSERDFAESENQEKKLKKVFLDEELNVICETENVESFPYGGFLGRWEIWQWLGELDSLSKRIPPAGVSTCAVSPVAAALARELDSISVLQHAHGYVYIPLARSAVEELVMDMCGVAPDKVSVLFYLLTRKKKKIRHNSGLALFTSNIHKVTALWSKRGRIQIDTDERKGRFECSFLVIALKPSEIRDIHIDPSLLNEDDNLEIFNRFIRGRKTTFTLEYKTPFWRDDGYSGEIFSLGGPVRSSKESKFNPLISKQEKETDEENAIKYVISGNLQPPALDENCNCKRSVGQESVTEQLSKCFGNKANHPFYYAEEEHNYIEVPALGDLVELLKMQTFDGKMRKIEWSCIDMYNNCDLDSALIAGYKTYINILYMLRPQALTFDDLARISQFTDISSRTYTQVLNWHIAAIRRNPYKTAGGLALASLLVYGSYSFFKPVAAITPNT